MNRKILVVILSLIIIAPIQSAAEKKPWTILMYMAGVNELGNYWLWNNIKEAARVDSNDNCNIITQIHSKKDIESGCIYFIEKNKAVLLNQEVIENKSSCVDSGNAQTLMDFYTFCHRHYPSENIVLIISGYGSGYRVDPYFKKCSQNGALAHDERYSSVISGAELVTTLKKVTELSGKKIGILGFDASYMASFEFAALLQPYCEIMVSSQDHELGAGWDYRNSLAIFSKQNPTAEELATQFVSSYAQQYSPITKDYTLSACNLREISTLNAMISEISLLLIELLNHQQNNSVLNVLELCRTKKSLLFDNETIDLGYFLQTIFDHSEKIEVPEQLLDSKIELQKLLGNAIEELKKIVIITGNGKNVAHASGLSIYFPKKNIETAYLTSNLLKSINGQNF